MTDEQLELVRMAAQRVIDDTAIGKRGDLFALAWARNVVARILPLGRPLGPGGEQMPARTQ